MTNYKERLDEILLQYAKRIENIPRGKTYGWSDEKQSITSLIKELVAEAKPEVKAHPLGPVTLADCQRGLNHYEYNLLKALEEL